ncbi:MAG: hypothetical protein ACI8R9_001880 [Paraglaciecola sp.]|jgi:hypothetical protein
MGQPARIVSEKTDRFEHRSTKRRGNIFVYGGKKHSGLVLQSAGAGSLIH